LSMFFRTTHGLGMLNGLPIVLSMFFRTTHGLGMVNGLPIVLSMFSELRFNYIIINPKVSSASPPMLAFVLKFYVS